MGNMQRFMDPMARRYVFTARRGHPLHHISVVELWHKQQAQP
jgi:hypothetical protein